LITDYACTFHVSVGISFILVHLLYWYCHAHCDWYSL